MCVPRSPWRLSRNALLGDAPEDLEQMRRFRAEQAELEAEIQVRERILSEIHDTGALAAAERCGRFPSGSG